MSDAEQMWVTAVPPFGPDGVGVLLAIDLHTREPGERIVARLTGRGHEGRAGVFHLLPDDLWARYERTGDRLAVSVQAWPAAVEQEVREDGALRTALAALRGEAAGDGRITLLRREIATDFVPESDHGGSQAVLLVEHGQPGPAALAELFAAFGRGEASFAVVDAG